jgi:hypothetical protein
MTMNQDQEDNNRHFEMLKRKYKTIINTEEKLQVSIEKYQRHKEFSRMTSNLEEITIKPEEIEEMKTSLIRIMFKIGCPQRLIAANLRLIQRQIREHSEQEQLRARQSDDNADSTQPPAGTI